MKNMIQNGIIRKQDRSCYLNLSHPHIPVETPVLNSFTEIFRQNSFGLRKICNRARDFKNPIVFSDRKIKFDISRMSVFRATSTLLRVQLYWQALGDWVFRADTFSRHPLRLNYTKAGDREKGSLPHYLRSNNFRVAWKLPAASR